MNNTSISIQEDLRKLLSSQSVFWDDSKRQILRRDQWGQTLWWDQSKLNAHQPKLAIRPSTEEDVARILLWCQERGISVVPRGGGSGVCGAAMAANQESVVIDLLGLNQILQIKTDGENILVNAQGGILGNELQSRLNGQGYELMHVPASLDISTLGGWIATKSFGQLSTLYGGISEQATAAKCAFPDGSIKNIPVKDILGSEGTLGVITSAEIKIKRRENSALYFSCRFPRLGEAVEFIREMMRRDIKPPVLRLYDPLETKASGLTNNRSHQNHNHSSVKWQSRALEYPAIFKWLEPLGIISHQWLLIAVFETHQQNQFDQTQKLAKTARVNSRPQPAQNWQQKRFQWNTAKVETLHQEGCFVDTLDMWAPWDRISDLYKNIVDSCSPLAMTMGHLSHFDQEGACLYVIFAGKRKSPSNTLKLYELIWQTAMQTCINSGGRINHHHGLGLAKLPWKYHAYSMRWFNHHNYLKEQLDPKGIMNPGKITG